MVLFVGYDVSVNDMYMYIIMIFIEQILIYVSI